MVASGRRSLLANPRSEAFLFGIVMKFGENDLYQGIRGLSRAVRRIKN